MSAKLSRENLVLRVGDAEAVSIQGFGVRFLVDAAASGGGFSIVEHPIEPKSLASPLHTHKNEDEYSYVIEGEAGMQIGDDVITVRAGDLVLKPRGIRHAFWNATDERVRILEIISPAGFERYFADVAPLPNNPQGPDPAAMGAVLGQYQMEMDVASIPELMQRYGLLR